jgi:hypothetical protein
VVTRWIDAVKMRVCGEEGGEKQLPSGVGNGDTSQAAGVALLTTLLLASETSPLQQSCPLFPRIDVFIHLFV